jgi:hypothetical protein
MRARTLANILLTYPDRDIHIIDPHTNEELQLKGVTHDRDGVYLYSYAGSATAAVIKAINHRLKSLVRKYF